MQGGRCTSGLQTNRVICLAYFSSTGGLFDSPLVLPFFFGVVLLFLFLFLELLCYISVCDVRPFSLSLPDSLPPPVFTPSILPVHVGVPFPSLFLPHSPFLFVPFKEKTLCFGLWEWVGGAATSSHFRVFGVFSLFISFPFFVLLLFCFVFFLSCCCFPVTQICGTPAFAAKVVHQTKLLNHHQCSPSLFFSVCLLASSQRPKSR